MADNNTTKSSPAQVNTQYVQDNVLHKFASYNYVFTLSGLDSTELKNATFLNGSPHDIVARSAGIGEQDNDIIDDEGGIGLESAKTLSKRSIEALINDRTILNQNRDIYFQTVEFDSYHGMGPQRGTGFTTKIRMKLVEPSGVTLFSKLRAAAANNGFRDHIDAPFLLTLEFKGFDELGKAVPGSTDTTTRHIPINIFRCDLNVNQAGTEYEIEAIPNTEFAYMDRFLYTRTSISLNKKQTLGSYFFNLSNALNKQCLDEAKQNLCTEGKQTEYRIIVHRDLENQLPGNLFDYANTKEVPMESVSDEVLLNEGSEDFGQIGYDAKGGQIGEGTSIVKVLEETMKSMPEYKNIVDNWFKRTVKNVIKDKTVIKGNDQTATESEIKKYLSANQKSFYVDWFRIKTSVETDTSVFDDITKMHKKIVTFYIYPSQVHVFRLAVPGASLGGANAFFVKKIYDYIFTGNNTDVLNLDINYKYAYFMTSLKDLNPNFFSSSFISPITSWQSNKGGSNRDSVEPNLQHRSFPGVSTTNTTGASLQSSRTVDVFMDQLTNPQADMVNVNIEIMGDPAWIPTTQWLPVNATNVIDVDANEKYRNDGSDPQWNERFYNFNTDVADPVVAIQFKMPSDFNDRTGLYNFNSEPSAMFSGLYQVYKTTSTFDNGAFRQTLSAVRFNNQSNEPVGLEGTANKTYVLTKEGEVYTETTTAEAGSF